MLAHEQGAMALIENDAWPKYFKFAPPTDNATDYIRQYAERAGPLNDQFVPAGLLVTLGDTVLYHKVPDGPPQETSSDPSQWNGRAARILLWYARNAKNPHYHYAKGWSDTWANSTPDSYLGVLKLKESDPLYKYGHYLIRANGSKSGILGWLYGKTNPLKQGLPYNGEKNWLDGIKAVCDGVRTRPIHALLVAYRMGQLYGDSVKDALRDYFRRQVPEQPDLPAPFLPELDGKGKRVRMDDHAIADLLDRMLKSDSPFVRTPPEPYPFSDKPLVVVEASLNHIGYYGEALAYGDNIVPRPILERFYFHYNTTLFSSVADLAGSDSDSDSSSGSDLD